METKGKCGENLYWEFNHTTGTLIITGSGRMDDYSLPIYFQPIGSQKPRPWENIQEKIRAIQLPETLSYVGNSAFRECSLLRNINIPNNVTEIGWEAFRQCVNLTEVDIPNSVIKIGACAFIHCLCLTSIHIPDSVTEIGGSAFYQTLWLNNQPDGLVIINNVLYKQKGNVAKIVYIPDSVTKIGARAFEGCAGLTEIHIPDSVTKIGWMAFEGCAELKEIHIPDSVTEIGRSAFEGCAGLTEIHIPDSVTEIGDDAFKGCAELKEIHIPDSVTKIGDGAFEGCTGLTEIYISDSVIEIERGAFRECKSLQYITIPKQLKKLGEQVFYNCKNLLDIQLPNILTEIPNWTFRGCEKLQKLIIPDAVTKIGLKSIFLCHSLQHIVIPESVKEIGEYAIWDCRKLTSVTLPSSIQDIQQGFLTACPNLKSIYIPKGETAKFRLLLKTHENARLCNYLVERDNEEITALYYQGIAYANGYGVPKNMIQAVLFYRQAAEKGHKESAYLLAEYYRTGEILPKNLNNAIKYYEIVAKYNYKDSIEKLWSCKDTIAADEQQMSAFMHDNWKPLPITAPQQEKVTYLFFDTETTGLPKNNHYKASPEETDIWPRMVQLAWVVTDEKGNEIKSRNYIIYPDGYEIPADADKIHGITTARARREGKDLKIVLDEFLVDVQNAALLVGHNIDFDKRVVSSECHRISRSYNDIINKRYFCTMLGTTNFCKLPNQYGYADYKWPKLEQLYSILFGNKFEDAHDASADVRATVKCYFELARRGVIKG